MLDDGIIDAIGAGLATFGLLLGVEAHSPADDFGSIGYVDEMANCFFAGWTVEDALDARD